MRRREGRRAGEARPRRPDVSRNVAGVGQGRLRHRRPPARRGAGRGLLVPPGRGRQRPRGRLPVLRQRGGGAAVPRPRGLDRLEVGRNARDGRGPPPGLSPARQERLARHAHQGRPRRLVVQRAGRERGDRRWGRRPGSPAGGGPRAGPRRGGPGLDRRLPRPAPRRVDPADEPAATSPPPYRSSCRCSGTGPCTTGRCPTPFAAPTWRGGAAGPRPEARKSPRTP